MENKVGPPHRQKKGKREKGSLRGYIALPLGRLRYPRNLSCLKRRGGIECSWESESEGAKERGKRASKSRKRNISR